MRTLGERFIPDIEFDKIYIQGFAIVGDAKANEAQIVEKRVSVRRSGGDAAERHERGWGRAWTEAGEGHKRARAAERKGRNRFPAC